VKIVVDPKGHMYYIQAVDGQCIIKEIMPSNSDKKYHQQIYEIKSGSCLAFSISDDGQLFYFMDDNKMITMLQRIADSRQLVEYKELKFKDQESADVQVEEFQQMIVSQKYLAYQSMLFYLVDDKPLEAGILDMERLN